MFEYTPPSNLGSLTYSYDANGRRTATAGSLAAVTLPANVMGGASTVYNADNAQTNFNGTALSYDANGNLTSDGTNTYTWDARNHLTAISGGSTASFVYDGFGRRVKKVIGSTTTQFLYDGLNPVQELNGKHNAAAIANLLTGLPVDEYFARTDVSTGVTSTLLADALGSTIGLVTSNNGQIATNYTYQPFGSTTAGGSANSNSYQFTGRENDGTRLYFYRARYYHPTFQRFVSQDPIGLNGGDSDLYTYVGADPMDYLDPFGLARKPGKTPPGRWPQLPQKVCGKKPHWNSEGYWEGKGRRVTWDDRSHGAGVDRGEGPQGGHWDDENSGNRWDENGDLLPGSEDYKPAPGDTGGGNSEFHIAPPPKWVLPLLYLLWWLIPALA